MRAVSRATWTSGEPVSAGPRALAATMSAVLMSATAMSGVSCAGNRGTGLAQAAAVSGLLAVAGETDPRRALGASAHLFRNADKRAKPSIIGEAPRPAAARPAAAD